MKRFFRKTFLLMVFVLHFLAFCLINYAMPSYKALNIVHTDVKRMDKDGFIDKDQASINSISRDVYFISAKVPESEKVLSFRNEDTRWGLPPYFKFNSADVQAKAASMMEQKALAQIKYYGWRIPMLNEFYNAISITKIKDASELSSPIFSYILYFFGIISFVFCMVYVNKKFKNEAQNESQES
ncbi:MAG: DUF1523 family protein [Campylobacter sp.]|nr:DUF1523 family protein [Campylobacter sp.]